LLGWSRLGDDAWVVAASHGLLVTGGRLQPFGLPALVRWDLIDTVRWQRPRMEVRARARSAAPPVTVVLELPPDEKVSVAVEERVTASVVLTRRHRVSDLGDATFVARRTPDGRIRWSVTTDPGVDASQPEVRAVLEELLADIRSSLGL